MTSRVIYNFSDLLQRYTKVPLPGKLWSSKQAMSNTETETLPIMAAILMKHIEWNHWLNLCHKRLYTHNAVFVMNLRLQHPYVETPQQGVQIMYKGKIRTAKNFHAAVLLLPYIYSTRQRTANAMCWIIKAYGLRRRRWVFIYDIRCILNSGGE